MVRNKSARRATLVSLRRFHGVRDDGDALRKRLARPAQWQGFPGQRVDRKDVHRARSHGHQQCASRESAARRLATSHDLVRSVVVLGFVREWLVATPEYVMSPVTLHASEVLGDVAVQECRSGVGNRAPRTGLARGHVLLWPFEFPQHDRTHAAILEAPDDFLMHDRPVADAGMQFGVATAGWPAHNRVEQSVIDDNRIVPNQAGINGLAFASLIAKEAADRLEGIVQTGGQPDAPEAR